MRFLASLLLTMLSAVPTSASPTVSDAEVQQIVAQEIAKVLHPDGIGAAVAIRIGGRTRFFNFGFADRASKRPITPDSLFNLASVSKVFDATLLSLAVVQAEVTLDDPVSQYITELEQGGDIRQVTLGQLATFTSGFTLPQDHPPWPAAHFTLPKFLRQLRNWKIDKDHERGKHYIYSHAGFMLLHVALERKFGMPYGTLLDRRLLRRLDLASTTLPLRGANTVGLLAPPLKVRAVQGYSGSGKPIGKPGNMQGYYHWPGTGQMFSTTRDMAAFLTAQLGEGPEDPLLRRAIALTRRKVAQVDRELHIMQAQAWEVHHVALTIIDKNGGLNNSTTYIGMVPDKQIGAVILINRGELNGRDVGHPMLLRLAGVAGARP
jgi:beta-lactamase class C